MEGLGSTAAALSTQEIPRTEKRVLTFDGEVTLYMKERCPWCTRVRNWLYDHAVEIEQKDIVEDPEAYDELRQGGGRTIVPCLKHGDVWLYESAEIIKWLEANSEPA